MFHNSRSSHLNIPSSSWLSFIGASALIVASVFAPSAAHAFSEDICFHYVDPQAKSGDVIPYAFNCWNVQCTDSPKPENAPAGCVVKGTGRYLKATIEKGLHARNTLHFDSLFLFSRMLGLSFDDAFDTAAYSEATDLVGGYVNTDQYGKAMTARKTDNLQGITRLNTQTGGYSYHFVPWLRTEDHALSTSLTYDKAYLRHGQTSPYANSEALINHLRVWAFGRRQTLCDFGLIKDQNNPLSACFSEDDKKTIFVSIPYVFIDCDKCRGENTFKVAWQKISPTNAGACTDIDSDNTAEVCVYDPDYAAKIHGTPKSLGIYLHVMADRLSHDHCTNPAFITEGWDRKQPMPEKMAAGTDYSVWFPDSCGTINHMEKHYPETGHKKLPLRSVKTLAFSYLEIQDWVKASKYFASHPQQRAATPRPGYPKLHETQKIVQMVGNALKQADAGDRNKALCEIALNGYGVTPWHDGSTDCKYPAK
ncbi:MAG: hypothetical protein M0R41_06510 [Methylobacter tundripaludum]|uniref:Uncharacterized protein n=1 Tax=Methylobacter tundripaludum TaxID=173365 RepID=A0A2S6GR32_9GAMM|nr:hypothetical protein [Methylobacter tundripaludum]MCK9635911.1 hypothetical protein [Methylobacter tundripaludum]PPK67684.1 hypothetical protein B0F88_11323 [Methylobacter tundripaludum]